MKHDLFYCVTIICIWVVVFLNLWGIYLNYKSDKKNKKAYDEFYNATKDMCEEKIKYRKLIAEIKKNKK